MRVVKKKVWAANVFLLHTSAVVCRSDVLVLPSFPRFSVFPS